MQQMPQSLPLFLQWWLRHLLRSQPQWLRHLPRSQPQWLQQWQQHLQQWRQSLPQSQQHRLPFPQPIELP